MFTERKSGILMPVASLPSRWGIGDFGSEAGAFVDFLKQSCQKYWQILPLSVTDPAIGNSPYNSPSAFAINPLYINPELLFQDGLLDQDNIEPFNDTPVGRIDYEQVGKIKNNLNTIAYEKFKREGRDTSTIFKDFCEKNDYWLDDYCLFYSIKQKLNLQTWIQWPVELRDRDENALSKAREELSDTILFQKFVQFTADTQWQSIRKLCQQEGIGLIGDIPIYVSLDSSDVWSNRRLYQLDRNGSPIEVSGVPPDYFSATGQLWGNPLYDWERMEQEDFDWWKQRIYRNLDLCDIIRIDHFRGLVQYWAVPSENDNALDGRWRDVPVRKLFRSMADRFGDLPLIAENLGIITEDVTEVMEYLGLPGMLVLQFAFSEDFPTNPYAPHNHTRNNLVYTGTHDNTTVKGWFKEESTESAKNILSRYTGKDITEENAAIEMIRMALQSVAHTSIIPLQDILNLDGNARINTPSRRFQNWEWRLEDDLMNDNIIERLREMTLLAGR